jgi:hypothetical protein
MAGSFSRTGMCGISSCCYRSPPYRVVRKGESRMNVLVEALFDNRRQAEEALSNLSQTVPELSQRTLNAKVTDCTSKQVSLAIVDSGRHDRLLFRLGLVGIIVGCLIGFALISKVPSREIMYLFILPLSGAFWGLGLSLTGAMLLSDSLDKFCADETELFADSIPRNGALVSLNVESGLLIDQTRHSFLQSAARLVSLTPMQEPCSSSSNLADAVSGIPPMATKTPKVTSLLSKTA